MPTASQLVRQLPAHLLDDQVFRTKYATWTSAETRDRAAERVARLLDTVAEYLSDGSSRMSGELRLIQVVLDNWAANHNAVHGTPNHSAACC